MCLSYVADPIKARGCYTNTVVIHYVINLVRDPFPPMALRCRQSKIVRNGDSSHKIEYITQVLSIINLKGNQNCIIGSN